MHHEAALSCKYNSACANDEVSADTAVAEAFVNKTVHI